MMRLILSLLSLLLFNTSYSQSIAPQSINSSGGKISQSNGSLSFTVGELNVLTQTDDEGNSISNGYTATAVLTTVNIQETDPNLLNLKVFPNPTSELLNIQIIYSSFEDIVVSISDLHGKEVYRGKYAGISNNIGINMAAYFSGVYIITLRKTNNQVLGTYKLIKQ